MALSSCSGDGVIASNNCDGRVKNSVPFVPLAVGLVVRLAIAMLPLDFLLAHIVPDDAFYYLTIARNVVHTGVFTFDRLAPTNGFHPLWQFLLLPISALDLTPEGAFRVMMLLQVMIEGAIIIGLYRLIGRLGGSPRAATAGALLYAVSPLVLTQAGGMNGMETALATLMLVLFLLACARVVLAPDESFPLFTLAAPSALLVVTRLDMAIPAAALYAGLLWACRNNASRLGRTLLAGLAPLALLALTFVINESTFGHPLPVSARSIAWMARDYLGTDAWGINDWAFRIVANLSWTPRYVPFGLIAIRSTIIVTAALLIAGIVLAVCYRPDFRSTAWKSGTPLLLGALALAWVVYIVAQTLRMPLMRSWYHGLWIVPAVVAVARLFHAVSGSNEMGSRRSLVWTSYGLAWMLLGTFNALHHDGRDSTKLHMAKAAVAQLSAGSVIGSWNSGTIAFFAPSLRVINLDGVVNNVAWKYIEQRRLADYVRGAGIEYLADDLGSFAAWGRYWTPEGASLAGIGRRLSSIPIPDGSDTIVLVRLPTHLP